MFCTHCGSELKDDAQFCLKCGIAVNDIQQQTITENNSKPSTDAPDAGFLVLCLFIPFIGLVLYLVWREEFPLKAKSCGKGALIGVCIWGGFIVFMVILSAIIAATIAPSYYALAQLLPLL